MNKTLTLGLLLLFCLAANAQKGFKITGTLRGFEDHALVKVQRENITLDSCYLKEGKFQLKGTFEQSPSPVYLIIMNKEDFVYTFLFLGNENITVDARLEDFPYDVSTKGSKYDAMRYEHVQLEKELNIKRRLLLDEMFLLREQGKWNDSLQKAYWGKADPVGKITLVDTGLDKIRDAFIDAHFNSPYGLHLLGTYKTELPPAKVLSLMEQLSPALKATAEAKSIDSHLKNPDLQIGQKYYDFAAFDNTGKKVKFSDHFNSRYVLLDFSTVYCGWCLKAIPDLEKIKGFQKEKLEIVTFYVDQNPKGFQSLVDKHHKDWKVLWDKEGRLSDTYAKYKVFGTPVFYLFGPDGRLVQKFDGYSEDLAEQIEKEIGK